MLFFSMPRAIALSSRSDLLRQFFNSSLSIRRTLYFFFFCFLLLTFHSRSRKIHNNGRIGGIVKKKKASTDRDEGREKICEKRSQELTQWWLICCGAKKSQTIFSVVVVARIPFNFRFRLNARCCSFMQCLLCCVVGWLEQTSWWWDGWWGSVWLGKPNLFSCIENCLVDAVCSARVRQQTETSWQKRQRELGQASWSDQLHTVCMREREEIGEISWSSELHFQP